MPRDLFDRNPQLDETGAQLSDWKAIMDSGTRITGSDDANNETKTLYTVPAGKIFYLVSAALTVLTTAGNNTVGDIRLASIPILNVKVGLAGDVNSGNNSFSVPIRMVAGETLTTSSFLATIFTAATIQGYEVNA